MSSPLIYTYNQVKQWLKIRVNPHLKDISFFEKPLIIYVFKILFVILILQGISGMLMSMYFIPSKSPIINSTGIIQEFVKSDRYILDAEGDTLAVKGQYYLRNATKNSIKPTQSYHSLYSIKNQSMIGNILYTFHKLNNHLIMFICLILPILAVFYSFIHSEYAFIWHMWWLSICILLAIAWTGYILPWTQFSATSYAVVTGVLDFHADWLGGNIITNFLGKNSEDIIARLFTIHSLLLPVLLIIIGRIFHKKLSEYVHILISMKYFGLYSLILIGFAFVFSCFEIQNLPADAFLSTMTSLKPEWFFLPYHGIIQNLPTDAGILCILLSIIIMGFIPYISSNFKQKMIVALLYSLFILCALMSYS